MSDYLNSIINGIDDRFISEYASEMTEKKSKHFIFKNKILVPVACACLFIAIALGFYIPIVLNGNHATDPNWDVRHSEQIDEGEIADLLTARLPKSPNTDPKYLLSFDINGRYDRERWNSLSFDTAYVNYSENINECVFDFINIDIYFPNNFVESSDKRDNVQKSLIYDHLDQHSAQMTVNGITVDYSDHSKDKYMNPVKLTDTEFWQKYNEKLARFEKLQKKINESPNLAAARSMRQYAGFYYARFEYNGIIYVISIQSRFNSAPLEKYLNIMIP